MERYLVRLEASCRQYGPGAAARAERLLAAAGGKRFRDAASLVRFHEALMFLRAFPHSAGVVCRTEQLLQGIRDRVERLRDSGASMSAFEPMEVSGIVSTSIEEVHTFDVLRWLVRRIPRRVQIVWSDPPDGRALAATLPRSLPLLDDDGFVEADIPWQRWLHAAGARPGGEVDWLIRSFEKLQLADRDKSELYDSLHLLVRWELNGLHGLRMSRTLNWRTPPRVFYHKQPLITRREVSLTDEFAKPAPVLRRLSLRQGEAALNLVREVMIVRHRELYGTTLGDPASMVRADVGRGVEMYLCNLPPDRRLPLRAYTAGFTLKNGVPINYFEATGLFEWAEVGFNTFYTFRDGETAWVYAQTLHCLREVMGATCFSIYPYQIGHENEEAIESGAFWFYRKLGFRPGRADLLRIAEHEEAKIRANPRHRTSAPTLRRLAEGHMFYAVPGTDAAAWYRFSTRNIGVAVNRRMAREFSGDSGHIRQASTAAVAKALRIQPARWRSVEQDAFQNLALVLTLVPDLATWDAAEKRALVEVIRAKASRSETRYLRLMQRHPRLRAALLTLGS
jgi:hypothetical protein